MKASLRILAVFFIVLGFGIAGRAEMLTINAAQVKVYESPAASSKVIGTLFKGDAVPVSNKPFPGFRKIQMKDRRIGYVRIADLGGMRQAAPVPKAGTKAASRARPRGTGHGLHNRWAAGAYGGVNYQNQGSRDYTNPVDGSAASISPLTGLSSQFGVFVSMPMTRTMALKGYVEMKSVSVTGTATYTATPGATGAATDTFLKENFLSLGVMGQMYAGDFSPFWFGAGLQMDKTSSGSIKFGGFPEVSLSGSDLVTFFMAYGVAGYDIPLTKDIFLIPEVKLGALFATPLIMEGDFNLNIAYAF